MPLLGRGLLPLLLRAYLLLLILLLRHLLPAPLVATAHAAKERAGRGANGGPFSRVAGNSAANGAQ